MAITNTDIKSGTHIYFHTPSEFAKNTLYYPSIAGYHVCKKDYRIHRKSCDNMLAICVLDGALALNQNGVTYTAERDEMLIVDCYIEHEYYAIDHANILWVHFDGENCRELLTEIYGKKGQKVKTGVKCVDLIREIIDGIKSGVSEFTLSSSVYSLICDIAISSTQEQAENLTVCVDKAKQYIKNNLQRELSVTEIAEQVHFSASYFSKIFKEATGFSPYAYIVNSRIEKAKKLLAQTTLPVSVIASETGFASEANFIYCFKQKLNISPLKFRKLKF